jgi:hypothetical protein
VEPLGVHEDRAGRAVPRPVEDDVEPSGAVPSRVRPDGRLAGHDRTAGQQGVDRRDPLGRSGWQVARPQHPGPHLDQEAVASVAVVGAPV